jgi:hypothetical protein
MTENLLRQTQVITTFGPGALVDLPDRSVIISGVSEWDRQGAQEIQEARLIAKLRAALGVQTLALYAPPAFDDSPNAPKDGIRARLFPTWFVTLEPAAKPGLFRRRRLVGISATERNGRYYRDPEDGLRKNLTPIRFVCACRRGHTDDVDWRSFVHRGKTECQRTLWIEERGTSGEVADTYVGCDCGAYRQLYEALDLNSFPLGRCNGKRPWLGFYSAEECKEPNRLLVRSASNAYFPETMSVISLPEEDDGIGARLDDAWDVIKNVVDVTQLETLRTVVDKVKAALNGITTEDAYAAIHRRRMGGGLEDVPVKEAEFEVLASGRAVIGRDTLGSTFFAETLDRARWDPGNDPLLSRIYKVVLIHRLREVVAQVGFTRLEPPAPEVDGELDIDVERQLLDREVSWLPAVEHRGEGVFIQIRSDAINEWLSQKPVIDRVDALRVAFGVWAAERKTDRNFPGGPYVLLHSLSHLLMTAIALDCGYPASSLRERVYALPGRYGILIHTGSSDAEGTLGGLVESGRRISDHFHRALDLARLCSNDPVCAEHQPDDVHERRFLHGAACHGCLLIAETSCEQRNDFLDRSLLIPTVSTPNAAFFPNMAA